ncbi:cyclic nucleotide-binding domain-containing protein [Lyngbya aestuarii]|uniref:cyclic nucleotide-binding domain-containing protein n=1 Tax=Lyngbya aestuarii TaxID=118322 RepID=UPI00403D923B
MKIDYKQFQAFKNLDKTQTKSFIEDCQRVKIPLGHRLVQQNSRGEKIFFVLEGEVRVFLDTTTGEQELAKLAAPTVLGEMSFFSGEYNSATVTALTEVRALLMPFKVLRQNLQNGDSASSIVVLNMAVEIAQRASAMARKIAELHNSQPDAKLSELRDTSKSLFGEWSFL